MLILFILFFIVFNSWCACLSIYALSWWCASKEEREELSDFQIFTSMALIAIASMVGTLGIAWFIKATSG